MSSLSHSLPAWFANVFPDLSAIQPLSRGGQKEVYSATHRDHGGVVLKIMHDTADLGRTAREVLAVNQVGSPRVPLILNSGSANTNAGTRFWFVEKRIDGVAVRQLLSGGPLDISDVLRLGLHVAEALAAAEVARIVHRDVKPDNIIRDTAGDFWLIDFGLARHLDLESLTATANPLGPMTLGYAPSEQWKNMKSDIDARTDLFALGVTLYECATGKNPLRDGANHPRDVLARLEGPPLPRLQLGPAYAGDLGALVATLMQLRRVHRPQTAREAHDWIKEICDREGIK